MGYDYKKLLIFNRVHKCHQSFESAECEHMMPFDYSSGKNSQRDRGQASNTAKLQGHVSGSVTSKKCFLFLCLLFLTFYLFISSS